MFDDWQQREVALGVALFLLSLLFTTTLMIVLLVRLPHDHLIRPPAVRGPLSALGWLRMFSKNLLGVLLVAAGIVLSLPGVPGQGLLTILAGVLLLDVPGKHRLERRLMARTSLFNAVNRVRLRFGKQPLIAVGADPDGAVGD